MNNTSEIKINCITEGFEEATQEVEALADAYNGFPSQVVVRNCRDCEINIYPSQTKIVESAVENNEEE